MSYCSELEAGDVEVSHLVGEALDFDGRLGEGWLTATAITWMYHVNDLERSRLQFGCKLVCEPL